ncbi:MAG: hypothetical protein Q7R98_03080 [Candidatus Jorgensenbacteria bacterium]|nr:hypothetical protein [Candidatus Jorgensenbacteria bacterium]
MNEKYLIPVSIILSVVIVVTAWMYKTGLKTTSRAPLGADAAQSTGVSVSLPASNQADGAELPVVWGNLGVQMTNAGVIDKDKFLALYAQRQTLGDAERELLEGARNGKIKINEQNAGVLLNLFWALGLGNKNPILDNGPMQQYGDVGGFASTGGWTIAKGSAMDHYSKYKFIALSPEEQVLVERVSKNIYRPCCGNSTYFPDCNHGMAMLGLLELMASQGVSEADMYETALTVNSYWFPSEYATINKYLASHGSSLVSADPKEILGTNYSSGSGYKNVLSQIVPTEQKGSSGCGV